VIAINITVKKTSAKLERDIRNGLAAKKFKATYSANRTGTNIINLFINTPL
jgi:hypothetical protein